MSEASRLENLLNYACRTILRKRRRSSASAAHRELGLSTLASRRKLHLAVTMFKCMSSKSPSYLSHLFLCFHPTTTPALLCLPSSTFHLIDLPLAKSHSVQRAQCCGNPCHWTSGTPENSAGFAQFVSNISGMIFDFYHLHVRDISLTCSLFFF